MITTLAVFRFDPAVAEMVLASYHPGQTVETVRAATGWDLRAADDVGETPTGDELAHRPRMRPRGLLDPVGRRRKAPDRAEPRRTADASTGSAVLERA